jgi:glycosyltransferase involved in cell wall biosynthesis
MKYLKRVHIHEPVPFEQLQKEISKYDYGFDTIFFTDLVKKGAFAGTNKFSSYLEAGLPIMLNKERGLFAEMVKKNKIGIVTEDYNFKDLTNKIKKANYEELVKNVLKFREKYSMGNNINKLIKFLEELSQKNK